MSAQPLPLYLRRYQVDIELPSGIKTVASDDFEPNVLRCTFDIQQRMFQTLWYADITLYNLSESLTSEIMGALKFQDVMVTVQAGYKSSDQGYGTIWQGPIFQTLFDREGGVDTRLTLHCVRGLYEMSKNFISQTYRDVTQADLAQKIADQAFTRIPVSTLSDQIKTAPLPRGKVVFGSPRKYVTQIAEDNNMQWWIDAKGLVIGGLADSDIPKTPDLTFTPPSLPGVNVAGGNNSSTPSDGIIVGTPQQTPYGAAFRALIDARVQVNKPLVVVKIDNSQIRRMKLNIDPGQSPQISLLDQDGLYVVAGTRFVGDTRGNDWYVEVDGFTNRDGLVDLLSIPKANTNSG